MPGPSGLISYVHKGLIYVLYIPRDISPHKFGIKLLEIIPSDPNDFQRWLAVTRDMLENVTSVLDKEPHYPLELSRAPFPIRRRYKYKDSLWITYVFNLDNLTLKVNEDIVFRLEKMPPANEWLQYLAIDESNCECVAPWMPVQYRAESIAWPIPKLSVRGRAGLECFDFVVKEGRMKIEKIHPSAWTNKTSPLLVVSEKLALIAVEGLMNLTYARICRSLKLFGSLKDFEYLAKDILTAACHAGSAFTFTDKFLREWRRIRFQYSRNEERRNFFWFRGRLVLLVRSIGSDERFKSEVGRLLMRISGRPVIPDDVGHLTAMIWSIHHAAVIEISKGKISLSDPIPVAAALQMDRGKLEEGIKFIMHYFPPVVADESAPFVSRFSLDTVLRIKRFCNTKTSVALGKTCKALRFESLCYPYIDNYRLRSCQGNDFLAEDNAGKLVRLTLEPCRCYQYQERYPRTCNVSRRHLFYHSFNNYEAYYGSVEDLRASEQ